jgi:hypothetical protein
VRDVWCNLCDRKIFGHGTTRVLNKIVFDFHALCWTKREICEALMRNVAGISPEVIAKEDADSRQSTGSAGTTGALPESLGRFIDDFDAVYEMATRRKVDAA